MEKKIQSATIVTDSEGRQYHINVAPSEMADKVLLFGDPKRVDIVKDLVDELIFSTQNRGYVSVTGLYKGQKISAMSTGIGHASTEIGLMELFQVVERPTLLRVGTCGAIQSYIRPGDFIISTGALPLEGTYNHYVYDNYPPISHFELVSELVKQSKSYGIPYHTGITASSASFYAGQGRNILNFPSRNKTLIEDLEKMNILNFEMEASTVLTLAALNQSKAGCLCVAVNNRHEDIFISPELMKEREKQAVQLGMDTILAIN